MIRFIQNRYLKEATIQVKDPIDETDRQVKVKRYSGLLGKIAARLGGGVSYCGETRSIKLKKSSLIKGLEDQFPLHLKHGKKKKVSEIERILKNVLIDKKLISKKDISTCVQTARKDFIDTMKMKGSLQQYLMHATSHFDRFTKEEKENFLKILPDIIRSQQFSSEEARSKFLDTGTYVDMFQTVDSIPEEVKQMIPTEDQIRALKLKIDTLEALLLDPFSFDEKTAERQAQIAIMKKQVDFFRL